MMRAIFIRKPRISDTHFANIGLLCHFDGADGATTTVDSSANGHTLTANGNAQLDTAQSVFGGSSYLGDGSGDYFAVPDHASLDLGTGAFTIEFRLRMNSTAAIQCIMSKGNGTSTASQWELFFNNGAPHLTFAEGGSYRAETANNSIAAATWYAIALERSGGGAYQFYVDGLSNGSTTTDSSSLDNTSVLRIGSSNGSGGGALNGWIDELRITKGVARYGGNYTPATSAFPNR
jgi:hypothetical protein